MEDQTKVESGYTGPGPFDYVKSISQTKENLMIDEYSEKGYKPYVINLALSYYPDTVLPANEMNMLSLLPKQAQYSYLINIVRPRKRYSKWVKKQKDDDAIEAVKLFYGYSDRKAREALPLLSKDQITIIKRRIDKGGLVK